MLLKIYNQIDYYTFNGTHTFITICVIFVMCLYKHI